MNISLVPTLTRVGGIFHLVLMHVKHGWKTFANFSFNLHSCCRNIEEAGAKKNIRDGEIAQREEPPDPHGPLPRGGVIRNPMPTVFAVPGQNLSKISV